ncbi:SDR family oxidoreductase [Hymenobacter sp. NBH84]|uniref:SDR family oxidoreductase n=1 Tax=Hymenobacter sp. NBH84 TaxID=2596915 RepID=UPI0016266582|nr:SDR family oxidoreductase [Hymenobacter sp. NBH84]
MPILQDKTILVTGATSGIGQITAQELAKQGAYVILLARNPEKAEQARRDIVAAAGHDRVGILLADLSDLTQVRKAASQFKATYPRLDVLVNNAGLLPKKERETSAQGYEMGMVVNHLGPFLLTSLLLPMLQESSAARIVNVASEAYHFAKPNLADFQSEQNFSALRVYSNTKLYNIMFTQELARRLRSHGIRNVTTNALHPGAVASSFGGDSTGLMAVAMLVARPFMISPEQGAQTSIFLASDPSVADISGGYYDSKQTKAVKHSFNTPENARRLWEISEELTSTHFLE